MAKSDLDLIYIRATDPQGNWNSLSLNELLAMGQAGQEQVANWLIGKLVRGVFKMDGLKITPELVLECVAKLEALGITVVKINPKLLEVADLNDPLRDAKKPKN